LCWNKAETFQPSCSWFGVVLHSFPYAIKAYKLLEVKGKRSYKVGGVTGSGVQSW